jgi:RNA polymerase sigma-70 factor (ECF subfamily)
MQGGALASGQLILWDAMGTQGQQPSSDIGLMNRVAQRDEGALAELYHHYGSLVYSLAMRILQNRELAEEITQDTFLLVWNRPEAWSPNRGLFSSWLLTVARYRAIDRIRHEQRRPDMQASILQDDLMRAEQPHPPDDPRLEDSRLLRSLLSQLPPEQAQVIELAFFGGLTHSALAELLNLPLGTVKTRLRLGLQKLRMLWESGSAIDGG